MRLPGARARALVSVVSVTFVVTAVAACGDDATPATSSSSGGTPTAGCGASTKPKGFVADQSITVGGAKRTYQLFVPESYDGTTALPLVFVFHGDGGTGTNIRGSFKLEAEAAGGAIFVYPDGESKTWQIDGADALKKDVGFIDALAAELASTHCTDKQRVFAVGFSKGAYFANQLACLTKSGLRAVVTHAGGGPFGVEGAGTSFEKGELVCPAPPVAALQVQGETDGAVPVSEGTKARDHWRRVNACKTTSTPYAPAPCIAYEGCAEGRPEIYCQIPGMGHTIWPENGTKVTWAFLRSF